jgi:hypothetical protein
MMRISVAIWEGTAEEAAALPEEMRTLLRSLATATSLSGVGPVPAVPTPGTLDPELDMFIAHKARSTAARLLVSKFASQVLSWEGTHAVIAQSGKHGKGDSLRFMRTGTPFGGFVYVWPGTTRVDFRLSAQHLDGRTHAYKRNVKANARYQVTLRLKSEAALAEAVDLAEAAMATVEAPGTAE